ncbi:penicillin-binding protein 1A [Parasediminibacterium sp. JCM 36343]|uniref:penicillin-binding protein 1A n=1 Tax=Parasediminibacterium sp. JCM 36343 TaxID=3374279 RepID=UPI00397D9B9D
MKRSVQIFWRIFFGAFGLFVAILLMANFGWLGTMPSIDDIENPTANQSTQVYAQDGTLMGKYYLEDRVNVDFKDISKHVINALVATEDERFYEHSGVDGRALLRAFVYLGREGGASTITMQTAKNLFTNYKRNKVIRSLQKLKEAIISIKLEQNFTKDEIITLYLNTVPFGDNVFGIRNAAKTFFQKEPDRLNVEEAAVLIGMLKGSNLYNPRVNPKKALDRRNVVLDQMIRNNFISASEGNALKLKPIELNYKKLDETAGLGPYFRMILGEEMKKWCKEHTKSNGDNYDLYRDGLKIYTTINPRMQLYAEEAVAKHMSYMQKILNAQSNIKDGSVWNGYDNVLEAGMKQSDRWKGLSKDGMKDEDIEKTFYTPVKMKVFAWNNKRSTDTVMTPMDSIKYHRQMMESGFMAMDAQSGEVRAWVGGIDFKTFKYDHVNFNTKRQVGSTMKPLLYSLAIEEAGFTPNTTVYDQQQSFGAYGMVPATSKSCSGRAMPMAEALAKSKNCATAYIMKQLDNVGNNSAKRFVDFLNNKCGLQTKIDPNPSIALGACEISLYEMMQAYSMLPGRGFNVKPMFITRIEDKNGNNIQTFIPQRKEVISDVTAYSVIKMMQGVMQYGTGRSMSNYDVHGEIAGKTGTTNDNSDAWFMGYTPLLLCGAWVGNDDRFIRIQSTTLGQGSQAAMPIWAYFYEKVLKDQNIIGIDPNATFVKPEVLNTDISFDNINNIAPAVGPEGQDGNGTSQDYGGDLKELKDIKPTSGLGPESSTLPSDDYNPAPAKTEESKPKPKKSTEDNRQSPPATLPNTPVKPKATMPKKVGGK